MVMVRWEGFGAWIFFQLRFLGKDERMLYQNGFIVSTILEIYSWTSTSNDVCSKLEEYNES